MDSWTQTILRDEQPEHGLTRRESGEQKFGPWALANYQLATLTDAVRQLSYVTAIAGRIEPKPDIPKPTPRPGANRKKVAALTPAGVAYLNNLRAAKGQ